MQYLLFLLAFIGLGCSDNVLSPRSAITTPKQGSVFTFEVSGAAQGIERDTFLAAPSTYNGKSDLGMLCAWNSFPMYIAYEANGDISIHHVVGDLTEWYTYNYGTKSPKLSRDTFTAEMHVIRRVEYRDTTLEVDGKTYAGITEEYWMAWEDQADGSITDEPLGHGYDVWIPSIGYYGLRATAPNTDEFRMSRLISFELKR